MDVRTSLPDDIDQLKQLLLQVLSTQDTYEDNIKHRDQKIDQQQKRIELLEAQIRLHQQKRFGASSEKHQDPYTLNLFNEAEWEADKSPVAEDDFIDVPAHKRKKKSRDIDPSLPRVNVIHDLPEEEKVCDQCNELMSGIKDDILEQYAIIPAQYFIIRHVRKRYACDCKACIKTASMPKQPIPKSQASPQILAFFMVAKYLDGLPLYRLEKIAEREGINMPRDKMARWLIQSSTLFQPIINLLEDMFLSYDISLADETGIQVLKEASRAPENKSFLWLRRGGPPDKPVVLVDYSPSRAGEIPLKLMDGLKGYLVTDAYGGYNPVMKKQSLKFVACNDHSRRKYKEAFQSLEKKAKKKVTVASQALEFYKRLYKLEKQAKKLNLDASAKYDFRQKYSVPIWKEFHAWLIGVKTEGVYDEKTRIAVNYTLKNFEALTRYCEDGRLPISNIECEHVAKSIAISRKNFMFCDTPQGAHASARIYSMLQTAKANGHHPLHYLTVLLTELPNVDSVEGYEALLPWILTPEKVREKMVDYPTLSLAARAV